MRAKFINEIKRNQEGSGLGSLGVGHAALTKGAIYIRKRWPGFLEELETLKNKKDVRLQAVSSEIAKWDLYCAPENIIVIDREQCPFQLDMWIDNIVTPEIEVYREIRVPGYVDYIVKVHYSKNYHLAIVKMYKEFIGGFGTTSELSLMNHYYLVEI